MRSLAAANKKKKSTVAADADEMEEEEEEEGGQVGGRAKPKGVAQSVNQQKRRASAGVEAERKRKGGKGGKGQGRGSGSAFVGKTGRKGGKDPAGVRAVDKFGRMLPASVGRLRKKRAAGCKRGLEEAFKLSSSGTSIYA
jgi:hypothetical protein